MRDFLDDLDLTPEERDLLRALGAPDAGALREMHRAAPENFDAYVGPRTPHLLAELDTVLPTETAPNQSAATTGMGSRLDAPPPLAVRPFIDLALRDRLFEELQGLRNRPASPQRDTAIADLEDRLNALLDESL